MSLPFLLVLLRKSSVYRQVGPDRLATKCYNLVLDMHSGHDAGVRTHDLITKTDELSANVAYAKIKATILDRR